MYNIKEVNYDTEIGEVSLKLNNLLKEKGMSIYKLSLLTMIKNDILYNYCKNKVTRYDKYILAKICYALDCDIIDIIEYNSENKE